MATAGSTPTPARSGAVPVVESAGGLRRPVASVPVWVWAVGLVGSLVVMGPALGRGSLLNLDLLVLSDPPVPSGMWGLGPELPRRVPFWGPLAWLSHLFGGELVGKAVMVAMLWMCFVGAWRLTHRLRADVGRGGAAGVGPWVAGIFYAFGPFFATRTAVGHLLISWVMAVLPWAVTSLLAPVRLRSRAVLWSAALGLGGVFGGVIAGAYLIAGLVIDRTSWWGRPRRLFATLALFLGSQLPWLVPLAVVGVTGGGRDLAEASDFAPAFGSVADAARLVAGEGFWNGAFQVARDQPALSALAGIVLLAAALFGTVRIRSGLRVALCTLAGISFVVAVSSAVPGLSSLADAMSRSALGAPLRDTQRALVPFLLWLAVAAGLGADRLLGVRAARSWVGSLLAVAGVLPLAAAIVVAVPAAWGFGGELRPVHLSPEWAQARAAVEKEPGTVVALPWFQYYTLDLARDRLTLGITPYYFGGDVIAASDPRLTAEHREEITDPRYAAINGVVEAARDGRPVSDELAAAGVRWVVLQHDVDWQSYTGVVEDPGLELVVSGPTLDLYRVGSWPGPGFTADGTGTDVDSIISPWLSVSGSDAVTLTRPYQSGWLRGLSSATRSEDGLIALPSGSGPVWYWPAVLIVVADLVWAAIVARMFYVQWRHYHRTRRERQDLANRP